MRENSIVITPVKNGFVVYLPVPQQNDFKQIGNMLVGMARKVKEDDLLGGLKEEPEERQPETDRKFVRDENCHVFPTFSEALAFLSVTFE